jgi:hypothetical protein
MIFEMVWYDVVNDDILIISSTGINFQLALLFASEKKGTLIYLGIL